jgi:biopolymer transport protein ExbD
LIFTILFFFMIVTTMREVTLKVKFTTPQGTELEKLGKKSTVSFIYIGPPTDALRAQMGSGTRIQLNDRYAEAREVMDFVAQERQGMTNQAEQTISIKADVRTQMGYITDVKEVLRKSWALRINYSATHRN